jgi:hypothetical protein
MHGEATGCNTAANDVCTGRGGPSDTWGFAYGKLSEELDQAATARELAQALRDARNQALPVSGR